MKLKDKYAFSILEIIIALGIAMIILNISYSYYKIYQKNARDEQRMIDLTEIKAGLENLLTKNNVLPNPEKSINLTSSGEVINTQGYFSTSLLKLNVGEYFDPLDLSNYIYSVNKEKNRFQLLGLLENNWGESNDINFEKRLPYTLGQELGIFLDIKDNSPIQKYSSKDLEILDNNDEYIVYLSNDKYVVEDDIAKEMAFRINPIANCLHILKNSGSTGDGVYTISPNKINSFKVYCDMTTDGGGWTLFYVNNGIKDSPMAESYVEMRTNAFSGSTYDLTDFENPTLEGLIDYRDFTSNGAKELLIKNNAIVDEEKPWGKIFFSSPETLEWALGDQILGSGIEKCVDLPEGETRGLISSTGKDSYNNLTQIMAHGGTSWGISHVSFNCNGFIQTSLLPHVAFYNANNNSSENRTRSNMLIGGTWGGENQYRYFIR